MLTIVMAGGEGTRLRPLTCNRPKPLVPVANKPIMEHTVELLKKHNLTQIIATLHYLADEIVSYFGIGEKWGVNISYSVEDIPLGTAGSVKKVESEISDTFLIISGDALCDFNLRKAISFHKEKKAKATLLLYRVSNPLEYGVVITDEEGRIVKFLEKPSWGEVFSDTINTGIYILEPEVLKYLEKDKVCDFSRDLFPLLLEKNEPIYGYIAEDYWCDVGSHMQYQQAHYDVLQGKVNLNLQSSEIKSGVWIGEGTQIDEEANIHSSVLVGKNCKIKGKAEISENVVIGDNCIIEKEAKVHRSIVWSNTYIGERSVLSGCIVGAQCVLKSNVSIDDGTVIGDNCRIHSGANIRSNLKVWPEKLIEAGATVSMSLIWGIKWPGSLFSDTGVKGLANFEITPEFATKLGAAYGASLEKGARVITSRDPHPASRMIKRGIIAGLMSVGANVRDLRLVPVTLTCHEIKSMGAQGGMHIRISPDDKKSVLLEFFDCQGMYISKGQERKIENIFFREDFRRTDMDDVGDLDFSTRAIDFFSLNFLKFVDVSAITSAKFKIAIDYGFGSLSLVFPTVLGKLKCDTVSLNAYVDWTKCYPGEFEKKQSLDQLSTIVTTLKRDIGVYFEGDGEKIHLVDEKGRIICGEGLLALISKLVLKEYPAGCIVVPVSSSSILDTIAQEKNGKMIRAKVGPRFLTEKIFQNKEVIFGGDESGGFIFPQFQPSYNGMIAFAKVLEFLSKYKIKLSEIYDEIPPINLTTEKVYCPGEKKGTVMRVLIEESKNEKIELLDGIKIFKENCWVLIRPDSAEPYFQIFAEASTNKESYDLIRWYIERIKAICG